MNLPLLVRSVRTLSLYAIERAEDEGMTIRAG